MSFRARFTFRGTPELTAKLRQLEVQFPKAFARALHEEAVAVGQLANSADYIPVDTGRMRASFYVTPPTLSPLGQVDVSLGYATDYAVYVHERPELRHVTGRAFWLRDAMQERQAGLAGRLATRTKRHASALAYVGGGHG